MLLNLSKICDALPPFFRRHSLFKLLLQISPESKIQIVHFNGSAQLYANISDPFPRTYFLTHGYDLEFISIASTFLSNGGTFFDVGANFGFCTFGILAANPCKGIKSYLFEANPEMTACLKKSASLYPEENIRITSGAVSNQSGTSRLWVEKSHLGSSYISPKGQVEVNAFRLDDLIHRESIDKIDFMKLDIEGSEPDALEGCRQSLGKAIIKAIYFEVSQETLARFGKRVEEYLDIFRRHHFQLFHVKQNDFDKRVISRQEIRRLNLNGHALDIAPVKDFPKNFQTDLLAIHPSLGVL